MSAPSPNPESERRHPDDRRSRPTPMLSRYTFVGRRRGGRREGETRNIYVDRHGLREWLPILAIMVLCWLDWRLTLDYIAVGGEEWNPIMAWALAQGEGMFGVVKMGVTTAGLLILLLHSRFKVSATGILVILTLYAALTGYHVYLRSEVTQRQVVGATLDRAAAAQSREAELAAAEAASKEESVLGEDASAPAAEVGPSDEDGVADDRGR